MNHDEPQSQFNLQCFPGFPACLVSFICGYLWCSKLVVGSEQMFNTALYICFGLVPGHTYCVLCVCVLSCKSCAGS